MESELKTNHDKLLELVKHHVDEILSRYSKIHTNLLNDDLRNDAIIFTFDQIIKKYLNDSRFENKKDLFIGTIAKNYIFGVCLENPK